MKFLLGLAALLFSGCVALKGWPAPDSGFLPHAEKLVPMKERAPFDGMWYADKDGFAARQSEYKELVVLPVDTSFLELKTAASDRSERLKIERIEDIREIGRYMRERFVLAVKDYPGAPLAVTEQIGDHTLVLELALVELNSTNPGVNTFGTAAAILFPGGGILKYGGKGSIAFEGILRDGATMEILMEFKDRWKDKLSIFTIKDFQQFAHARSAIEDWAKQFAELAVTPHDHKVESSWPVTLNPF